MHISYSDDQKLAQIFFYVSSLKIMLIQPRLAVVYQEFYHGCENSVSPEATRGKLQIFTTVVKSGIPRLAVVELIYLIAKICELLSKTDPPF